jgi:hypothetical protein
LERGKVKNIGIAYQGGKRLNAEKIINAIHKTVPNRDVFVDLFGGGASISLNALLFYVKDLYTDFKYKKVIYNDVNKYTYAFIKYILKGNIDWKKLYKFVSRKKFFDVKENPKKYDDYFVGYIRILWSFQNNLDSYTHSVEREKLDRVACEYLLYGSNLNENER